VIGWSNKVSNKHRGSKIPLVVVDVHQSMSHLPYVLLSDSAMLRPQQYSLRPCDHEHTLPLTPHVGLHKSQHYRRERRTGIVGLPAEQLHALDDRLAVCITVKANADDPTVDRARKLITSDSSCAACRDRARQRAILSSPHR